MYLQMLVEYKELVPSLYLDLSSIAAAATKINCMFRQCEIHQHLWIVSTYVSMHAQGALISRQ